MDQNYERHKESAAARQAEQSRKGRDIGKIPPVKNKRRRKRCEWDLPLYLKTYYPETFYLDWAPYHVEFLAEVQQVLKKDGGGRKAIFLPRASGKTQCLTRACNWAISYGHRKFIAMIASESGQAEEIAEILMAEWESNELLLEDFPEIAYPITELKGINQRAKGQTCGGKRTHIVWRTDEIVFPSIEKSAAAGACIKCMGILGRIRGMAKVNRATKKTQRPDVFLIDDFQSDTSALSDVQCAKREIVLSGAIGGLGGPGKTVAGLASSTIIRQGDLASRIANRELYPRWRATKYPLVKKWPTGKKAAELWEQYLEIRKEELAAGEEHHPKATAFYKKNRKVMDRGAKVLWEGRHEEHELSALQHAYGLKADNALTWDAEYQNDPKDQNQNEDGLHVPTPDEIVVKQDSHKRGTAPKGATRLFCGIDVQESSLWWYLLAVDEDFSGWTVDRGVWPPQPKKLGSYFTLRQVAEDGNTIAKETGEHRPEVALRIALKTLTDQIFKRRVKTGSGEVLRCELALIDDGYQTKTVQAFCNGSSHAVLPCKGDGVGPSRVPYGRSKRQPGERRGPGWKMPPVLRTDEIRHVLIDKYNWDERICHRWNTPVGAPGAFALYKAPHILHRMLADQLGSHYAERQFGKGRWVYVFHPKPSGGEEDHWRDAERMACVGASVAGVKVPGEETNRGSSVPRKRGSKKKPTPKTESTKTKVKRTMAERRAAIKARKAKAA